MEKTNVAAKSTELVSILNAHFQGKINLARVKLMSHFIIALCKVQTVSFEKLANAFDTPALAASSLRRIQRFIASFVPESDIVARLVFSLLPERGRIGLVIDRTNWKFGDSDVNIFMLGVVHRGVAFPLLFTILPKTGNSNVAERIALVERFIGLFGEECIEFLVADREFVGGEWMEYLNRKGIRYHIRIRNDFKVFLPHKNREVKAFHLFNPLKPNRFAHYPKIVRVNGKLCYISGCRIKGDWLILVSFNEPKDAERLYKDRWQMEMCFKAMKSSGFDMEKTHLDDPERVRKLVLLIMIAFVWCYKVGIYLDRVKPIKIKKHGRLAKSVFKYGLNFIASVLLNIECQSTINIFRFLSCT